MYRFKKMQIKINVINNDMKPFHVLGLAPLLRKLVHWLSFGWELLESLMISGTMQLNKISKDYRYVSACLSEEKRRLKVGVFHSLC